MRPPRFVPSSTLPKTRSLTQNSWHVWPGVRTRCCSPNLDSWPKFKAAICPSQHRHLPELTRSDSLEFGGSQDTSTVWWNCGKKGVSLKCFVGMMLTCSRWMCCSCPGYMKFRSAHILKADKSNVRKVVCLQKKTTKQNTRRHRLHNAPILRRRQARMKHSQAAEGIDAAAWDICGIRRLTLPFSIYSCILPAWDVVGGGVGEGDYWSDTSAGRQRADVIWFYI